MNRSRYRWGVGVRVSLILLAASCVWARPTAQPAEMSRTVYYQVTYADGEVRDLPAVPRTNKGIRMVLRISRYDPDVRSFEVYSTGPTPLTLVRAGRTVRRSMTWNEKAWVAVEDEPSRRRASTDPGASIARPPGLSAGVRKVLKAQLARERRRVGELDRAVAEANKRLADARGDEARKVARASLTKARRGRGRCAELVREYETTLAELKSGKGPFDRPVGKVFVKGVKNVKNVKSVESVENVEGGGSRTRPRADVSAPAAEVAVLPYRVQVWRIPDQQRPATKPAHRDEPASGDKPTPGLERSERPGKANKAKKPPKRSCRLSMAHGEAGARGGFYYVAYADTDGDGVPDKLIARSPLAQADRPGQWTGWEFTTNLRTVFVGNAWTHPDTTIYHRPTARPRQHPARRQAMDSEVYVSGFLGALPRCRRAMPFLGDIHVRVNQNPDRYRDGDAPKVIIDER